MKKLVLTAAALVVSFVAMAQVLPANAKEFIDTHFPNQDILMLEGRETYTVTLDDRTQLEFNHKGQWKEMEAAKGSALPDSAIPTEILERVNKSWAGKRIVEIQCNNKQKKHLEYEVELEGDIKVKFNANFMVIDIDE